MLKTLAKFRESVRREAPNLYFMQKKLLMVFHCSFSEIVMSIIQNKTDNYFGQDNDILIHPYWSFFLWK